MLRIVISFTLLLQLISCAGVIKGTSQTVTINSEPSKADVYIDGNLMGKTPLVVKLKKKKHDSIMIKKDGYDTVTKPLETSYDATALLNVFWDSSTTDMITGAAYEYEPSSYYFKLEKEGI